MDEACDGFLAGAGGAGDEYTATGGRHPLDQAANAPRDPRRADESHLASRPTTQGRVLPLQPVGLDGPVDDEQKAIGLKRFLNEIVGPVLDRRYCGIDRSVSADHHHGDRRVFATDHLEELQTVEVAALQPDIENDQCRPALAHGLDRLAAVVGPTGGVPLVFENARDQRADVAFVVDDQDIVGHDSSNRPRWGKRIIVRPWPEAGPTRFPSRRAGIPD